MNEQNTVQPGRHPLLPAHLNVAELAHWLDSSAVERYTDEQKRIFEPEELKEFEHESSVNGREMNRLGDIVAEIKKHVTKGNDEAATFTLPATAGTKLLEMFRRQNDDLIERGYEMIETKIFGIPNPEEETMEFFDIEGKHIIERTRPLSPKEKRDHLGMFQKDNSKLFIPQGFRANSNTNETGEVEDDGKTGTNG